MLDRMPWTQLVEWQAYYALEPFGEQRADSRSALIAMMLANINRDPKKKSRPYELKDFMLFDPSHRKKSPGESKPLTDPKSWAQVKRMAAVFARGQ